MGGNVLLLPMAACFVLSLVSMWFSWKAIKDHPGDCHDSARTSGIVSAVFGLVLAFAVLLFSYYYMK